MTPLLLLVITLAGVSSLPAPCFVHHPCTGCHPVQVCHHVNPSCAGTYCDNSNAGLMSCSRDGVLPDPSDCRAYHLCHNGAVNSFRCASGQTFNGTDCKSYSTCETLSCGSKLSAHMVIHPIDYTVYGYCINGVLQFVDRCPPNYRMYSGFEKCLPECRHDGSVIVDPDDVTSYYRCSRTGTRSGFSVQRYVCSVGSTYCPSYAGCYYNC